MFGKILKSLRENNGYSMDKLIEIYNKKFGGKMNKSTLSRYENEIQEPMYTVVVNLANIFNVSVDYLSGAATNDIQFNPIQYNQHDIKVLDTYKSKPEMQPAVDKLLGVDEDDSVSYLKEEKVIPFIAAESGKEYKAKPLDLETMIELDKLK